MPRKKGRKARGRKAVPKNAAKQPEAILVDLNLVKSEPVEFVESTEIHDTIDKLEVDLSTVKSEPRASPPTELRKSNRLRTKQSQSSLHSQATEVVESPKRKSPAAAPISSGFTLPKLRIVDGSEDDDDEDDEEYPPNFPFNKPTSKQPPGTKIPASKPSPTTTVSNPNGSGRVIHLPPDSSNYENMSQAELLEKVKTLSSNYEVDQKTIGELQKNHSTQLRAVSSLEEENEKLRESSKNYQLLSEKERWRAEDAWKKLETTKLYNKATEEGTTQRYFLQQKYASAIDEVRTGCEKRLKELEKDRAMLSRENSTLTRNMSRSKNNHVKMRKKLIDLKSLVRVFSNALSKFVDLNDVDIHLGVLGDSYIKRYNDCIQDKENAKKELNVSNLIANQDASKTRKPATITKQVSPETDSESEQDDLIDVPGSFESETAMLLQREYEAHSDDFVEHSPTLVCIKNEQSTPPQSPPRSEEQLELDSDSPQKLEDGKCDDPLMGTPPKNPEGMKPDHLPQIKAEDSNAVAVKQEVSSPEETMTKIKKELESPPSSPVDSIPSEDELRIMLKRMQPITMEEPEIFKEVPSLFDPDNYTPVKFENNIPLPSAQEKTEQQPGNPASMPDVFGNESNLKVDAEKSGVQIKVQTVSKTPKIWRKNVTYPQQFSASFPTTSTFATPRTFALPRASSAPRAQTPPECFNKYVYQPSESVLALNPREYAFDPTFKLVSPIVTPPARRRAQETLLQAPDNQVIEFESVSSTEAAIPSSTSAFTAYSTEEILPEEAQLPKAVTEESTLNTAFLATSSTDSQEISKVAPEKSFEVFEVREADPNNPYITHWDSDKSERLTPPIMELPIRRKRVNRRKRSPVGSSQRVNGKAKPPRLAPPRKNDSPSSSVSVRSRLNECLGPVNPNNGKNQCEKLRLDKQIRDKRAKKRDHSSSSSDEGIGKVKAKAKKPRRVYSMDLLFGEDPVKIKHLHNSPLSDLADNEFSDLSEENLHKDLEISDDEQEIIDIQPPASPDPDPVAHQATPMHFDVNPALLEHLENLLKYPLEVILSSKSNLEAAGPNELATCLYTIMVQTQEHEYLASISRDDRVSVCPLIPRFQSLFAVMKNLPLNVITAFLELFNSRVIPNDKFREIENDQLLVNIGRFIGAISLNFKHQELALDVLFNFLLYRPPFAYSFAHGLLCSDTSVIGYSDFWPFDDLDKKRQAILITIHKHPRFGDARYAKPVIEMIKRSLSIIVPDLTYDQFISQFLDKVFAVESDKELQTCARILAMYVVQNGLAYFEGPFITRFFDWTSKWSTHLITDGVFATLINSVGIIAEALRRSDLPTSTEKQQAVLMAVGRIVNAPALIQDCVSKSILKLRSAVVSIKSLEEWDYERRKMPGAPQKRGGGSFKKKFKKFANKDGSGDQKQGTWVLGSRKSPKKRYFGKNQKQTQRNGGDWRKGNWSKNKQNATPINN